MGRPAAAAAGPGRRRAHEGCRYLGEGAVARAHRGTPRRARAHPAGAGPGARDGRQATAPPGRPRGGPGIRCHGYGRRPRLRTARAARRVVGPPDAGAHGSAHGPAGSRYAHGGAPGRRGAGGAGQGHRAADAAHGDRGPALLQRAGPRAGRGGAHHGCDGRRRDVVRAARHRRRLDRPDPRGPHAGPAAVPAHAADALPSQRRLRHRPPDRHPGGPRRHRGVDRRRHDVPERADPRAGPDAPGRRRLRPGGRGPD